MDNLVDLESEKIKAIIHKIKSDPEPDHIKRDELEMWQTVKRHNDEGRRVGLGLLGLGDVFAMLGLSYACRKSIEIAETIAQTIKLSAYRASVDMAKELGHFKCYDSKLEATHPFIQLIAEEEPELYKDMLKYGRRNIALTTVAPTGSISLLTRTTSGIEPLFASTYTRRKKIQGTDETADFVDKEGVAWKNFTVVHPQLALWSKITGETDLSKSPYAGSTADAIDWTDRVKLQAAVQKHVCSSISSTVNLPSFIVTGKQIGRAHV